MAMEITNQLQELAAGTGARVRAGLDETDPTKVWIEVIVKPSQMLGLVLGSTDLTPGNDMLVFNGGDLTFTDKITNGEAPAITDDS